MTQTEMWEGFETGQGPFFRPLRIVLVAVGMVIVLFRFSRSRGHNRRCWAAILLLCIWLSRVSDSYLITLTLLTLSMFATFRYGWWRVSSIIAFFQDPGTKWGPVDVFFIPAAGRGGLCVCNSVHGILPDGVAAAAGADAAARRSTVAGRRRLYPDL